MDNQIYEINEIERDFDKQTFLLSQNLQGINQESIEYETSDLEVSEAIQNEQYLDSEPYKDIESDFSILKRVKNEFTHNLTNENLEIKEITQNFLPAILPALRVGIKLLGRERVVNTIAGIAAPILKPMVKEQATPLSRALVDAGLKFVNLETPETITGDQYLGATVSNILTEATDKITQLPDNILDSQQEILESFIKDALFTSIANNIPSGFLNEQSKILKRNT